MYQALYRKYRPKNFDTVYGQDIIVKTLKNSIIHKTFSHAYLFYGPRGTGKTTFSKIFARNINCLNPNDGSACGICKNCLASFSSECVDIIEIDAASNNGVDEIRDLKSKINIVPSDLLYKVYIIDEVHMLTDSSFNALLKTLEEPPEHVVFILATTDPQKIPSTIVSRCQCFAFKPIPVSIINDCLSNICNLEKINIDKETINNISVFSEGGMRDALSMLDKLVSFCDGKITLNDFIELNGIVSIETIHNFLFSILSFNIAATLSFISEFDSEGRNLVQIMSQLLNYSRNVVVDYYVTNNKCDFDINLLLKFASFISEKMFDIKKSFNTRIYIEILLINFITISSGGNYSFDSELVDNSSFDCEKKSEISEVSAQLVPVSNIEDITEEEFDFSKEFDSYSENNSSTTLNVDESNYNNDNKILNINEIMNVRINNCFVNANKTILNKEKLNFEKLKDYSFDSEIGYLVCSLLDSTVRVASDEYIIISYDLDSSVEQNCLILHKLEDVYGRITNSFKKFVIISDSYWDKIKKDYIDNLKNGFTYKLLEEPKEVFDVSDNHDIISNKAVDLFGEIVEIE